MFSPEQEKQIIDLRTDGFTYVYIAGKVGVKKKEIQSFCEVYFKPKPKPIKVNKYDFLLDEPMAQGHFYKDYVKLDASKKYAKSNE